MGPTSKLGLMSVIWMNNLPLKLGGRSNNCSRKSFNYPIHSLLHKCRNRDQGLKFSFFDTKFLLSFIPPLSKKRSLSCYQHPFRSCVLRRQRCIQYEVQCFPLGGKCRPKWNLFFWCRPKWNLFFWCRPQWNLFFGADQSGTGLGSLFWRNFGDNNSIKFLVLDDII